MKTVTAPYFDRHSSDLSSKPKDGILSFETNTISIRDVIRVRVEIEVDKQRRDPVYQRFFANTQVINKDQTEDEFLEYEIKRAWRAFEEQQYLIFTENGQVEKLDERLSISSETRFEFFKITPLEGG